MTDQIHINKQWASFETIFLHKFSHIANEYMRPTYLNVIIHFMKWPWRSAVKRGQTHGHGGLAMATRERGRGLVPPGQKCYVRGGGWSHAHVWPWPYAVKRGQTYGHSYMAGHSVTPTR